jgi:FkbM family methyltransferase
MKRTTLFIFDSVPTVNERTMARGFDLLRVTVAYDLLSLVLRSRAAVFRMRKYINDAHLARKAGRTTRERLAIFWALVWLRLKRRFGRRGGECGVKLLGYEVWGFSYTTLEFLFREVFLSGEYRFEAQDSRPLVIDCGANIGMSVLFFKHLFPAARIIAFEANPHAYRLLERNMRVNDIEGVELHNTALSDREGEISFFVSSDPGTLLGSTRGDRGGSVELKVRAEGLAKHVGAQAKVDLIKIDVEGSETGIVNELIRASALGKPEQYIIEYHHRINGDRSALAGFLDKFERAGYDYNIKASFRRPGSFQDVLVHFYKEGSKGAASGRGV